MIVQTKRIILLLWIFCLPGMEVFSEPNSSKDICTGSWVTSVSVSVAPSANLVCAGTSVTFTATPTNGGTTPSYQWKVDGVNSGTDNPVYTYKPNNGEIVTCVLTSNAPDVTGNPATSNAITMVVNPLPGASVTGCTVVCSGSTVTLSGNPSGGTPSYTHAWAVSTPGLINLINKNDGTATITVAGTGSAAGTYTVTDSYGCVTTALFNIGVNQQSGAIRVSTGTPSALIASAIASRWQGFTSSGVYSALYLGYSSLGGAGERSELGIVNYLHPGNNTISFKYDKGADKLTASINGSQVVYNNVASQVNIFSLGKASVDGMNYLSVYMRNTSAGSISLNNLVLNGISLSPFNGSGSNYINWWTISGLYFGAGFTLTGTLTLDAGTYGSNEDSKVELSLGEKIDFTCISTDPAVCSNQPATVYLSGLIKNRTYTAIYSIDGMAVVTSSSFTSDVNSNGSFQTINLVNSTSVPVTKTIVMTSLNCGSVSLTINCNNSRQVVVNPAFPLTVSISAAANQICKGTSVSFTATQANGGTAPSYQWKVNGANAGTNSSTYTYAPENNDAVTCVLTSSDGTCATGSPATSNTVIMAVNALPIATAESNIPVCVGNTIKLTSSGGTGYSWSGPNGFTSKAQNPSIPNATASMSGNYTVTVTALNGCTNTAIANVTVNELPLVNITSSNSLMCINDLRTLTGSPAGGTFKISGGPGIITGNVLSATGIGNINLEYNYSNVCANKVTQSIIVTDKLNVFAGPDQLLKFVFETQMKAELPLPETGEWSLISGSGIISEIHSPTTRVTELSTGENIFLWKVRNGSCEAAAEVKITVYDPFIPSVITPDGDGKNDYFKISEIIGQVELVIINRWGGEEYTNANYLNDWDGRNNKGVELPNDTYFYIFKFENVKIKRGSVLIKR